MATDVNARLSSHVTALSTAQHQTASRAHLRSRIGREWRVN
jgi:hypothetical protein